MGSSEFGESSGKLLETMLAAQKSVRDNMRTYLETMNVPTREDIARLGELVVGLEEKIDQVADRLDAIEDVIRAVRRAGRVDVAASGRSTVLRADRGRQTIGSPRLHAGRVGPKGAAGPMGAKRLDTIDKPARRASRHARGRPRARPPPSRPRPAAQAAGAASAATAKPRPRRERADDDDRRSDLAGRCQRLVVNDRALEMARAVLGSADAPGRPDPQGARLAQEQGAPVPLPPLRAGHPPDADLPGPPAHQPVYILDLRPGASFVEFLLGEGFDVFLIDWGTPGDEDQALDVTTLVTRYLPRAAKAIQRATGPTR